MAIKLYTGIQGSGKSYEVVTVVILGALREGRRIVSNIAGLNYEAMREILIAEGQTSDSIGTIHQVDHEDVIKLKFWRNDTDKTDDPEITIQPGDVLILDEIWRFWENRSSVTERQQNFFRMHRHMVHPDLGFTCEIVLITQDVSDVCTKIRAVVEKTFVMSKHTELGTDKFYRVTIYSRAKWSARTEPLNIFQRKYNPELFKLYKSHSTNTGEVQAKERSIDKRGNIWSRPAIKYGIPFSLLLLLPSIYFLLHFFNPDRLLDKSASAVGVDEEFISSEKSNSPPGIPLTKENINAQILANSQPEISDAWRVVGFYDQTGTMIFIIENASGVVRQLIDPPKYKMIGFGASVELPEGGFATTWTKFASSKEGAIL